jgi:hypothetical protein
MITRKFQYVITVAAILASSAAWAQDGGTNSPWQKEFGIADCDLRVTGANSYFILEPGHRLVLEGDDTKVQITVLDETKTVDGVITRVVEEREWKDGKLYEISRNYFVICEQTKDVFYFGEDVDYYEGDKIIHHDGAWLAGVDDNKPGLIMAGAPRPGMKYYQEIAPGTAMDRAEIVSLDETCKVPAGTFSKCLKIEEGTELNIFENEYKYYAPGIGLIHDEDLVLTKHGFVND